MPRKPKRKHTAGDYLPHTSAQIQTVVQMHEAGQPVSVIAKAVGMPRWWTQHRIWAYHRMCDPSGPCYVVNANPDRPPVTPTTPRPE